MRSRDAQTLFAKPAAAFAPGRVNLIGEHTDYNGGLALPVAAPLGVRVAVTPSQARFVRIASDTFESPFIRLLEESAIGHWSDYVLGAAKAAIGPEEIGFDVSVCSNLPAGSGLSSSAAVIVAVLKAISKSIGVEKSPLELAKTAWSVEQDFIGVPCGMLDQMAVAVLQPRQAMLLDCNTLAYQCEQVPQNWRFAVYHTGIKRALTDGRYADRKDSCMLAAKRLKVGNLCDAALSDIGKISDDTMRRRARHVISENNRVSDAHTAMRAGQAHRFGELMNESHKSMRDDFEISLPEIDDIVEIATSCGALGARLTGGGFGGCIVCLVEEHSFDDWQRRFEQRLPQVKFLF